LDLAQYFKYFLEMSTIAKLPTRMKALGLYKRILRTGKTWTGSAEESSYIQEEAKTLFRKNKNISDPEKIERKITEGLYKF
jgi:hypothetical protein